MTEIIQALGFAAGLLLPVVILVVIATIAAANRGEAAAHVGELAHGVVEGPDEKGGAGPAKLPLVPDREPTVLEILILGIVLFTLVMGGLLGLSLMGQMG